MTGPLPKGTEILYGGRRMRLTAWLKTRLREERGQGMTEYVIVAMLAMIPLIVLFVPTMTAIRIYLQPIYFFVGLPFP